MGRAPCCEKDSVKRGPWTPEEDAKLLACIGQYGTGSWRTLPKKAGLQRCGKSCRLRWTNYLRPDLKHGRFSDQEEQLIVKLHAALGSRWSLIAAQLPGRTDNDVKNYWNTRLKKKLCEMGIDPITHKPISQLLADLAGSMTLPKGNEIAEATLGCFKDDMLNVLMRKRSDTLIHNNINMSFAPLTLPPNHVISPSSPPHPFDQSSNFPHLLEDSFRRKPTPSPCGPVSGIRSLAARSNPLLNQPLHITDHSHINSLNNALPITNHSSADPKPENVPSYSPRLSPLYSTAAGQFPHASSFNDPSSCMLDMLLDQTSYSAEMEEVPDLNLVNDHHLQAKSRRTDPASPDQEVAAKSAIGTAGDHPIPANHACVADGDAWPELAGNVQQRRIYTALLQQQEKGSRSSTNGKDEQRASMHADIEQYKAGKSMRAGDMEHRKVADQDIGHHNMGDHVMGSYLMQEWSPVSYTNSGSSSSNLSLSVTPLQEQHHIISPLDNVLTSDALLWDLSELGSMVS